MLRKLIDAIASWLDNVHIGTVEKIELTFGEQGQQHITVSHADGSTHVYSAWLNYKDFPKIGQRIHYEVCRPTFPTRYPELKIVPEGRADDPHFNHQIYF